MCDFDGEIEDWTGLADFVSTHGDGDWLFRGVTDAENHTLVPKIARDYLLKGQGSPDTRPYNQQEEDYYFRMFMRQARPHVVPPPLHHLEWMTIAQHHGLPTRLLDWTWSPLVAAYFATEASGILSREAVDAAIYAIHGFKLITPGEQGGSRTSPFSFEGVRVYDPPHISPRVPAQRGAFTLHGDPRSPLRADQDQGERLERWVISSGRCFEIKRMLDVCAINRASLFPDLDGLARQIEWRYKWTIGYTPPE